MTEILMTDIYDEVNEAQGVLSMVDLKNPLLNLMRTERGAAIYSPKFVDRYCGEDVVSDNHLRKYIGDLKKETDRICRMPRS